MPFMSAPTRLSVPLENWDDDPAFDIPDGEPLQLSSSPSSSSSSSRGPRHSLTLSHQAGTSSPLRQSVTSPPRPAKGILQGEEIDDMDDFTDVPSILPSLRQPPSVTSPSASVKRQNISATILQSQFKGIGTVTKLTPKVPNLPNGSVKARAKAIEQAFEEDIDFDVATDLKPHRLTRAMLKRNEKLAEADAFALDGLEIDETEDNEATLKASATLKAQLPPRKNRNDNTIKAKTPVSVQKESDEAGFDIPSGQWVLTLPKRPTEAIVPSAWDSSGTSTSGHRSVKSSLFDGSPKRHSDTSVTSLDSPTSDKHTYKQSKPVVDAGDDMEDGLDLGFFANKRATELTNILDRKRLAQYVPPTPASTFTRHHVATNHSSPTGDESMEDGLVLSDPRSQLTRHRLSKPSSRASVAARRDLRPFVQDKAAQRELEQGWNRPSPVMPPPRSTNPLSRRHQATPSALLNHASSSRPRPETPRNVAREPELSKRTSRLSLQSNGPAPTPLRQPSTPSRLRHQQSYSDFTPSRQQTLSRVQSHASLVDSRPRHPRQTTEPSIPAEELVVYPTRYHSSTSRLLSPTKASLAKSRPPLASVFSASSSASSISTAGMATPKGKEKDPAVQSATLRLGEVGRGRSYWHSGTELEGIEDLPVDSPKPTKMSGQLGLGHPGQKNHDAQQALQSHMSRFENDKGRASNTTANVGSTKRRRGVKIGTIHPMGAARSKTVNGLTYDPEKQKWLGNDEAYRKFSPPPRNTVRPALISPFPGTSGTLPPASVSNVRQSSATAAIRVVGDMRFDPEQMCWVHIGEEPEEDPFAGMLDADDEDDIGFGKGGTITRASGRTYVSVGQRSALSETATSASTISTSTSSNQSSQPVSWAAAANTETHEKERARSGLGGVVSDELRAECREAEARHRDEMRPWAREGKNERDREVQRREERTHPFWEIIRVAKGL